MRRRRRSGSWSGEVGREHAQTALCGVIGIGGVVAVGGIGGVGLHRGRVGVAVGQRRGERGLAIAHSLHRMYRFQFHRPVLGQFQFRFQFVQIRVPTHLIAHPARRPRIVRMLMLLLLLWLWLTVIALSIVQLGSCLRLGLSRPIPVSRARGGSLMLMRMLLLMRMVRIGLSLLSLLRHMHIMAARAHIGKLRFVIVCLMALLQMFEVMAVGIGLRLIETGKVSYLSNPGYDSVLRAE